MEPAAVLLCPPVDMVIFSARNDLKMYRILFQKGVAEQLSLSLLNNKILDHFNLSFKKGPDSGQLLRFKLDAENKEQVRAIFVRLTKEYMSKIDNYQAMILNKVVELFIVLKRLAVTSPVQKETEQSVWSINAAVSFIKENYSEEIRLPQLATRCGITPAYFSRLFHEKVGVPLFEYLNRIRIQKACLLLKRSQLSIIDIAYSVGYNNLSFFNRYFKKIMNMSPRQYKNII